MIASFPLVHRWGRDVHCVVGVLGSLTIRYYLSYRVKGAGRSVSVGRQRKPELNRFITLRIGKEIDSP